MKRTIILLAALALAGCNDWLDVKSDTRVVEKDLFSSADGFHAAVNGVYTLLADSTLYSMELNWGMLSVLANNYEEAALPTRYVKVAQNQLADPDSRKVYDPVWESAYNAIANANNVLLQAEGKADDFFPAGRVERNMIMGEMLGVRAMLHLDMLRLFAPAKGDGKFHIPYVDTYPAKQSPHLTVEQTLQRITTDLAEAKRLLREIDVEYNPEALSTLQLRMGGGAAPGAPLTKTFYTMRGTRMNWVAATALLSRAHLWGGNLSAAAQQAQEVLDYNGINQYFSIGVGGMVKMPADILLAAWSTKQYDYLAHALQPGKNFCYKNEGVLFTGDGDDYRQTVMIGDAPEMLDKRISMRWQNPGGVVMSAEGKLAPIIRLSEMAYTICEALIEAGETPTAIEMLNVLRFGRGAKRQLALDLTKEEALEALHIDMMRDWMSEGQTFFLFKRLGQPIFNGQTPLDINYVLPVPRSENDYTR